jgi:hypothetical protein
VDDPESPPAPPSRRRLMEAAALLILVVLGLWVYRQGHAPEAGKAEEKAAQEAAFAAVHDWAWPPQRPADLAVDPDRGSALVLMDQLGGETFAQARDSHYLYFGRGRRLVGYDLTQATWPAPIGASRLLAAAPRAIAVRHGFAYVGLPGENSLHVLAVPDPDPNRPALTPDPSSLGQPFGEVGTIAFDGPVVAVAVDRAPKGLVDRLYAIEARGSGPVQHFLTVVDIADPHAPRVLKSTRLPFTAVDVASPPGVPRERNVLYLAVQPTDPQGVGGIAVMEDPLAGSAAPEQLGFVEGISAAQAIRIGKDAYVIGQPAEHAVPVDGMMQLDLTDPSAPRRVDLDFAEMPGSVGPRPAGRMPRFGMLVADPETYSFWAPTFAVALSDEGLPATPTPDPRIMDLSALRNARVALASVDVYGDRMYAIAGAGEFGSTLWNLQRPHRALAYSVAQTFEPGDPPVPAHLAADRGVVLGIRRNREGLQQIALSNLDVMNFLPPGSEPAFGAGRNALWYQDVYPVDPRISGLQSIGFASTAPQSAPRVAVDGDFGVTLRTSPLLGAAGHTVTGRVKVLDLYRPSLPEAALLGEIVMTAPNRDQPPIMLTTPNQTSWAWPPHFEPWDIALQGRFAYVTTGDSLRVIDILHATEVGRLDGLHLANDIAVAGGFAYIADAAAGLRVIDLRRQALPRLVATLRPRGAVAVALYDGGLAVLDRLGSLSLFRLDRPGEPVLASRIEPLTISPGRSEYGDHSHPAHPATELAAAGRSVFLAGHGFVWAASTDAPEIQSAVRDDQLLGQIESIAAVDGLLFVSDRSGGLLAFDHAAAPYWAEIVLTVREPLPAAAAKITPEADHDDAGETVSPLTSFKVDYGTGSDRTVWLDGPPDALARLGRKVFLDPVDVKGGQRVFRFAGRRDLRLPPGVRPVGGSDDAGVEVEYNWAPTETEEAALAAELAEAIPTRTAVPSLPTLPPPTPLPVVVPDFSTLRGP